ncbi:MAG: histidine kinase [Gallionella sp.]|nr:histidine kinase [Gallionella sp.]
MSDALPNFRNLGIVLKIILLSNVLVGFYALALANSWSNLPIILLQIFPLFTPILLFSLLLLWVIQPQLSQLSFRYGVLTVNGLVLLFTLVTYFLGGDLYHPLGKDDNLFDVIRYSLLSAMVCNVVLIYFRLRNQVLSRALHDARLQALRARIRPHFLFNTLNMVLAIIRSQPKQAETALEDMADLFRSAMSETADLVPLSAEITLSKQYLALEQLRLCERLQVNWVNDGVPDTTLIPPLLLQPLLENAVYHGIEPLVSGGTISITLHNQGETFQLQVNNTCSPQQHFPHSGNKMALRNIRERLILLFDVEAQYEVERGKDFYRVTITLPYGH